MIKKSTSPKIIVVLGPTATGKSDLGVVLAKKFNGEIISADSRQIYKGLDIGSGKVTNKEKGGIKHHLLDVASPARTFTVTRYQTLAQKALRTILKKKKVPIIVGGTGLYIDALLYNYKLPEVKPNTKLRAQLEKKSTEQLFALLTKKDSQRAQNIDRHNRRRLIRALEILAAGVAIPSYEEVLKKESKLDVLKIGLTQTQEELRKRIHARLLKRMARIITEIKKLRKSGLSWKRLEALGLEYRYVSRYLQGGITKKEMMESLEKEIWHYAKRQMTWFKRDASIHWIQNPKEATKLTQKFLAK